LIAGGCSDGPPFLGLLPPWCRTVTATAELYDPATGTFVATGNMTSPRAYHTATVLPNGRVLIAAGVGDGGPGDNLTSAELYDPSTGIFSATGQMNCKGAWTSTLLLDGRFLISGSCVELYDPAVGTFKATNGR